MTPKSLISQVKPRKTPLSLILIVPFVLQIFAAVGLVGFFSYRNGQKTVDDLADQLMDKASQQVNAHLDAYLGLPQQLAQLNREAIAAGQLNLNDQRANEQYFWRQAKAFEQLSYIGYALMDGREAGAGRWVNGVDLLVYENLQGQNNASDYLTNDRGERTKRLQSYEFDPLSQVAFVEAIRARQPIWDEIFTLEVSNIQMTDAGQTIQAKQPTSNLGYENYVVLPARSPIYDQNNQPIGAVAIDLLLTKISQFLRELNISSSGQVFVMERNGKLVASSSTEPILQRVDNQTKRLSALDSPDPLIRSVAQALQQQFTEFQAITGHHHLDLLFNNQHYFVQVTPWRDSYGLDWLVVVTVPESDFMAQIEANTRMTIALSLGALVVAIAMGIWTSRWITRPILQLSAASQAIAVGQLEQQVAPSQIREIDAVGRSFNQMAQQLQDSFAELAQTNADLENRVELRTADLSQALENLQRTQAQLVQTEKMSSLGQLVAGVAHEINNPVNFIHGNLTHVQAYLQDLLDLNQLYQTTFPQATPLIQAKIEAIDLEFLVEDSTKILQSMRMGTERIREIVRSLRNFSRLDEADYKTVDIHEGIESTLVILQNRLRATASQAEIQIIRDYQSLPPVECYAGQLNQVFMNIMGNAIDALRNFDRQSSTADKTDPDTIRIWTEAIAPDWIAIHIVDNGPGMTEEVRSRVFDPFFTTKPVGQGTGLGLSISYQIVTEKHSGKLDCYSTPGQGTEFVITIPLQSETAA